MKTIIKSLVPALMGLLFVHASCGSKQKSESALVADTLSVDTVVAVQEAPEVFEDFLKEFTSSTEFQYSRVIFPLGKLSMVKGDAYEVPFTKELYFLVDKSSFKERDNEEVFAKFTYEGDNKAKFEENGQIVGYYNHYGFERKDGKWYLTSGNYSGSDIGEYSLTVKNAEKHNAKFLKKNP